MVKLKLTQAQYESLNHAVVDAMVYRKQRAAELAEKAQCASSFPDTAEYLKITSAECADLAEQADELRQDILASSKDTQKWKSEVKAHKWELIRSAIIGFLGGVIIQLVFKVL